MYVWLVTSGAVCTEAGEFLEILLRFLTRINSTGTQSLLWENARNCDYVTIGGTICGLSIRQSRAERGQYHEQPKRDSNTRELVQRREEGNMYHRAITMIL